MPCISILTKQTARFFFFSAEDYEIEEYAFTLQENILLYQWEMKICEVSFYSW